MGHIGCPETSVTNYHHTLRNITEWRRSHIYNVFLLKMDFPVLYVRPKASLFALLETTTYLHRLQGLCLLRVLLYRNFTLCARVSLCSCYCCVHFQKTHENIVSAVSIILHMKSSFVFRTS